MVDKRVHDVQLMRGPLQVDVDWVGRRRSSTSDWVSGDRALSATQAFSKLSTGLNDANHLRVVQRVGFFSAPVAVGEKPQVSKLHCSRLCGARGPVSLSPLTILNMHVGASTVSGATLTSLTIRQCVGRPRGTAAGPRRPTLRALPFNRPCTYLVEISLYS